MQKIRTYICNILQNLTIEHLIMAILYFLILYQIFANNHRISLYPLQLLLTQGIQGETAIFVQQIIMYTWTASIFLICLKAYHLRTLALCIITMLTGFKLWIFINNFMLFWKIEPFDMVANTFMTVLVVSLLYNKILLFKK